MKIRQLSITTLCLCLMVPIQAQTISEQRSASALAVVGYNPTYRTFGGLDLKVTCPIGDYFAAEIAGETLTAGTHAVSASLRPGISVDGGRFFLDGRILYRAFCRYEVSELAGGLMVGYRRQYFSVQMGGFTKNVYDLAGSRSSTSYPLEIIYSASFCVRPLESRWNVGGTVSNFTPFEIEREFLPFFMINGNYNVLDSLSVVGELYIKPAGMFNMQANFFGIAFRAGVTYKF